MRLGGHEAPPAIISVFIGSKLTRVLDDIERRVSNKKMSPDEKAELKLDIGKIPEILLDNTDRKRTSLFAFTGNRFEFRAVGSNSNTAGPITALNAAVANQLKNFYREVKLEMYVKRLQIEARVLGDLATNHIIPIAIKYQNILIENMKGMKEFN